VIRDVTYWADVAATLVQVAIQDDDAAPECVVVSLEALGVGTYQQWQGRVVVPAGGIITLTVGDLSAGSSVYVGGYLLRNTLS